MNAGNPFKIAKFSNLSPFVKIRFFEMSNVMSLTLQY